MKANRKFVEGEKSVPLGQQAVSAVIGVILMVAITVAIAGTVWYYVSTMLPTTGATDYNIVATYIAGSKNTTVHTAVYTIATTDEGLLWSGVTVTCTATNGTVTDGTISHSPSGDANIEVTQTMTLDAGDDAFTGTFKLLYDGTDLLWTSGIITV